MITTIFGMNRVVNSIREGIDIRPRIGPITNPTNRSITVQPAPNTTCMKTSGQIVLTATATTSATSTIAASTSPNLGTISKSGIAGPGPCSVSGATFSTVVACTAAIITGRQSKM